ncbi:MAG: hypothetical protein ACLVKR_05160 [Lachnospiraceae bacterium]
MKASFIISFLSLCGKKLYGNLIIFDGGVQMHAEIWTAGFPTINSLRVEKNWPPLCLGTLLSVYGENSIFNRVFLPWDTDPEKDGRMVRTNARPLRLIKQEYPATPEALEAPGGCFFDSLKNIHIVEPFAIPAHWRRYHDRLWP